MAYIKRDPAKRGYETIKRRKGKGVGLYVLITDRSYPTEAMAHYFQVECEALFHLHISLEQLSDYSGISRELLYNRIQHYFALGDLLQKPDTRFNPIKEDMCHQAVEVCHCSTPRSQHPLNKTINAMQTHRKVA